MSTDSNSTLARVWNMFSSAVARWEDFFIFCGFGVQWTNVRIERTTIDQMSEGKGKGSRAQLNYSLFRRERVWKKKPQNTTGCPHLLVDWAGSTWIQCVPLSAQFCLGWWEFGRSGWARWWNNKIKVNQTQVHKQMGHPVVSKVYYFNPRLKKVYDIGSKIFCPTVTMHWQWGNWRSFYSYPRGIVSDTDNVGIRKWS